MKDSTKVGTHSTGDLARPDGAVEKMAPVGERGEKTHADIDEQGEGEELGKSDGYKPGNPGGF